MTHHDVGRGVVLVDDAERLHRVDDEQPIGPDQLAVEAVEIMERFRINQLLVADDAGFLVGALHIHDLTRAKVI